ncbi:unnamed protein product [Auanema sp. JU1783]|nr:unnamed protein product [Auanema sp. JU1783]
MGSGNCATSALLIILLCNKVASIVDWNNIQTPPVFVHQPNERKLYFKIESQTDNENVDASANLLSLTIRCNAIGNPRPTYSWYKNGKPLPLSMYEGKIAQRPGEGTLDFSKLEESDVGEYKCMASNDNGTAVSDVTQLELAWIRSFPQQDVEVVKIELGDSYIRDCVPAGSNPPARVFWILKGEKRGVFHTVNGSHISSNDNGTLYFHYVKEDDLKEEGLLYTCTAENTELKEYKFGSPFKLEVTKTVRRQLKGSQKIAPGEQYVNQSSPIALQNTFHKLHCFFSGYPLPKPTWFHNGIKIDEDKSEHYRFEAFGKTLVFNVTQERAGKYDCQFPDHDSLDRTFNVVVEAAPYWPDGPPPHTNTSEGDTVTFDCTTSGKPVPLVTFYKNGVEMVESDGRNGKWVIDGNKLTIYDVKKGTGGRGDNAVYQCKAENKHGYVWANFFLNLLAYKPQLLTDAGEVEAVSGQSVTLSCEFFASPNANISWNSPKLQGAEHVQVPANAHGVGKLVINNVKSENEGEYECVGVNKYGEARGNARLLVRKPTRLLPFQKPEEVFAAGEPFRLPCEATADDKLDIKYEWLVNGEPLLEPHVESGHYTVEADNTLVVKDPSPYDSAKYKCIASTKLDKVEKEVSVHIKDVPVPVVSAKLDNCAAQSVEVKFQHQEPSDTISPVTEFWIHYQIDPTTDGNQWRTHPVPVYAKDKDPIIDGIRTVSGSATIALQPYGHYIFRVIARNAVGDSAPTKASGRCDTDPRQPDRNPIFVGARGASPENIIVNWKPMGREEWNGPDFHYLVKYRPKDSREEFKTIPVRDPFADKVTVNVDEDDSDAKPFQPYEIQIQAVNSEGVALVEPQIEEGYTGEGVPSSIPTGFRLVSTEGTSATFAWNPVDPQSANGNFSGYKVTYWHDIADDEEFEEDEEEEIAEARYRRNHHTKRVKRQAISKQKTAIFGPSSSTGVITDLKPDTVNYATIQVINNAHDGPASEPIRFKTAEGVPTAVRNLRAYPMNPKSGSERGVVVLLWKKPRQANGKILHYMVSHCRSQNGKVIEKDCPKEEVSPDKKQLRVSGLEYETEYQFTIRAHTSAGEGDPSSSKASTLPESVTSSDPGVPTFKEDDIGNDFFNVTFFPSDFDKKTNAPVGNHFLIQYKESDSDDWKEYRPEGDDLTATVAGLVPGTEYDVRVAALQRDEMNNELSTFSQIGHITTTGRSPRQARLWLLLLILLILLLLLIILCIICVAMRHRGQNYPVSEKEREQGREPILGKQHFGEFRNDDEKRSLTGSKAESETDSMAEYGDTDPGRFTEDGSFIGQYVPQNKLLPAERPEKGSTSTFV